MIKRILIAASSLSRQSKAIEYGSALLTRQLESFGCADSWDEKAERYRGLRCGDGVSLSAESATLLVKPDIAAKQRDANRASAADSGASSTSGDEGGSTAGVVEVVHPPTWVTLLPVTKFEAYALRGRGGSAIAVRLLRIFLVKGFSSDYRRFDAGVHEAELTVSQADSPNPFVDLDKRDCLTSECRTTSDYQGSRSNHGRGRREVDQVSKHGCEATGHGRALTTKDMRGGYWRWLVGNQDSLNSRSPLPSPHAIPRRCDSNCL